MKDRSAADRKDTKIQSIEEYTGRLDESVDKEELEWLQSLSVPKLRLVLRLIMRAVSRARER